MVHVEADQAGIDLSHVVPHLHWTHLLAINSPEGVLRVPAPPGLGGGVTTLERQPTAGCQHMVDGAQRLHPCGVVEEDLCHMAGHDRQVCDQRGNRRGGVTVDPAHLIVTGPGAGHGEHAARGVDAGDLMSPTGQFGRKQPCSAADVDDRGGADSLGQGEVELDVVAAAAERVIEPGQPGIAEVLFDRHRTMMVCTSR